MCFREALILHSKANAFFRNVLVDQECKENWETSIMRLQDHHSGDSWSTFPFALFYHVSFEILFLQYLAKAGSGPEPPTWSTAQRTSKRRGCSWLHISCIHPRAAVPGSFALGSVKSQTSHLLLWVIMLDAFGGYW